MKKIALISFTNPFVNNSDGGKVDIINRIKALNNISSYIDVFTLLKKDEIECLDKGVQMNNIYTEKIKNSVSKFIKIDPISVSNRYADSIVKRIENENKTYDLAIYENFNMYRYKYDIKSKVSCLRVHNIESLSRKELFKSTFPEVKAFAEYLEAIKYSIVEKKSLELFDYFLFISTDELEYMSKKYPKYKKKFVWMPPVIEKDTIKKSENIERKSILYYGDLTISHNIRGLKWYIRKVFSKIKEQYDIDLIAIGKISDSDKNLLNKIDGVETLGYVDDLDKYISKSEFIIAPILTGAGVKIKVLHALGKGKIVLTTPKGIEGTSLKNREHLIISNNEDEFIENTIYTLNNIDKLGYLSENALNELESNYSIDNQVETLNRLIEIKIKERV